MFVSGIYYTSLLSCCQVLFTKKFVTFKFSVWRLCYGLCHFYKD